MFSVTIYRILDPRTSEVVYVGQTVQALEKRLHQHIHDYGGYKRSYNAYQKSYWFANMTRLGFMPIIEEIEVVTRENRIHAQDVARRREKFWIKFYHSQGCKLLNWHFLRTLGDGLPNCGEHKPFPTI